MPGYQSFHPDVTLNFMANRMMADIPAAELREFARGVDGIDDWIDACLRHATKASEELRHRESGCYFRAAEFFMAPDHQQKTEAYDQFLTHFDRAFPEVADIRTSIPFDHGELGVIDVPAKGTERDVIVACSGFDGLIEEMYASVQELARNGYRVILYEGPGQGAALRKSHLPMIREWERPVSAVLDHLAVESCTLMGLSLGGYLAPRAAAFESRAKRLIVWGANFSFVEGFRANLGDEAFKALMTLMDEEQEHAVNQIISARMKDNSTTRWAITHGIHTCGGETPYDFIKWGRTLHLRDVSDRIQQDTLILHGSRDHLIPRDVVWTQAASLTHAHSTTVRIFTEFENAGEHCQVTNGAPVYREILNWFESLRVRDASGETKAGCAPSE